MIEINLLPEELRPRIVKGGSVDAKAVLGSIPLVIGALVVVNILLWVFLLIREVELGMLNAKWEKLQPQQQLIDNSRRESAELSADAKLTRELLEQRIAWGEKLNKLSLYLPSGVWFKELSVSAGEFLLKGSVISLEKEEMTLVNTFVSSLKKDPVFVKNFGLIEVSSVQKRLVGSYEVADFVITAPLK